MLRSLKVTNGWLKRVKQALSRYDFSSQKALAEELEISTRKINDFFNGKTVEYEIFVAICTRLELDWQKVAKVTAEVPKANQTTQAQEAIADKNMEQSKKSEGIPKLASSLFKTFDSQDRTAQKKFVDITTPAVDSLRGDRLVDNSVDELDAQLTDRVRDSDQDLVDVETLTINTSAKFTKSADSKNKGATEIHELLGINTNTVKNSTLNPVSIAQIQELLGMVADIKNPNQLQDLSPELHNLEAIADIKQDSTLNLEPISKIEFTPPSKPQPQNQTDKIEVSHNLVEPEREEAIKEVTNNIKAQNIETQNIKAQILDIFKPEQSPTAIESSPPKVLEPPLDRLLHHLELSSESTNIDLAIDLVPFAPDAEKEIAAEIKPFKPEPTLDRAEFSLPSQLAPDRLEPILTACYDACEAQDWDMAASIVNGVNLSYVKKVADLVSILDLYNQLLPLKWQDGEQKISDRPSHWQVIYNAGMAAFYLQRYTDAVNYYETALAIAHDHKSKIQALNGLGQVYQAVAQYQRAIKYYQQAQTTAKEARDNHAKSQALSNLGNIYYALHQYRTAVSYYQEFLQLEHGESSDQDSEENSRDNSTEIEFSTIGNLGNAYYNLGEYQTAISYQQKYLEVTQMIGNSEKEAISLVSLGFSYYALGLYQTAIAHYQDAKAIADKYTSQRLQISIFSGLGSSYQALKNYATAVVCFHKCLEVARQVGDRGAEVKALYNLRKANSSQHI